MHATTLMNLKWKAASSKNFSTVLFYILEMINSSEEYSDYQGTETEWWLTYKDVVYGHYFVTQEHLFCDRNDIDSHEGLKTYK